jgi:hypothetical protein
MRYKDILVVLDFDGFLINSYKLLKITFEQFGLNIGDEERFKHRRKFLKYLGGGKELLRNLVAYSLPKQKKIREVLTEVYQEDGRIYKEFVPLINEMVAQPALHVGIISRNFTHAPGNTIRTVLGNSEVNHEGLDFLIPIGIGVKKHAVLEGMRSPHYRRCLFGADEIGDYRAAVDTGYDCILMASYGFDKKERLLDEGGIPAEDIFDTPRELVRQLAARCDG